MFQLTFSLILLIYSLKMIFPPPPLIGLVSTKLKFQICLAQFECLITYFIHEKTFQNAGLAFRHVCLSKLLICDPS